ncbi:glycosyltransferase [Candidatus Saccharibacteria bacterium]|nr:glycosyltransferase [Candidatus Saccharibacteria bacterium]
MKIAIMHDWFDQVLGGSELVAIHIAKLFPEADIFTMLYNEQKFGDKLRGRTIKISNLQKIPSRLRTNHKLLLPLIPQALKRLDFSGYDLVISSSPAFSKNITVPASAKHLTYCHSPMRFAWDYWPKYIDEQSFGLVRKTLANLIIPKIRKWDLEGVKGVDLWLANSNTVKGRIDKYYGINDVEVLYPPVNLKDKLRIVENKDDYYVTLGALTPYKRIDLAIKACNLSRRKLIVMSDGPQRRELEAIAGDTIKFVGFVSGEQKWDILRRSRGLIFPTIEDFGMAPIEAMAVGVPVIALKDGGLTETVEDHVSGVFFEEQTSDAIIQALDVVESINFDYRKIAESTSKYSSEVFDKRFKQIVKDLS